MVTWYSSPPNEVQRLNLLCDDIAFLCLRNPGPNSRSHTAQKDALWSTRFLRTIIHPLLSPHSHQLPPDSAPHLRTWGKLLCIINPLATMALGCGLEHPEQTYTITGGMYRLRTYITRSRMNLDFCSWEAAKKAADLRIGSCSEFSK